MMVTRVPKPFSSMPMIRPSIGECRSTLRVQLDVAIDRLLDDGEQCVRDLNAFAHSLYPRWIATIPPLWLK
jgi:hypothetical protein